jgi:hypothetical protein
MLTTQNLGVKIAIILSRDGPCISLSSDLDTLVVGQVDMFYKRVCVEWVKVKSGEGSENEEDDEKVVVVVVGSSAHAATLWWMIVLLSPRTISIPKS